MAQGVRNDLHEKTFRVSWKISQSVHEQLKTQARKHGVSERLLAENAIVHYLKAVLPKRGSA